MEDWSWRGESQKGPATHPPCIQHWPAGVWGCGWYSVCEVCLSDIVSVSSLFRVYDTSLVDVSFRPLHPSSPFSPPSSPPVSPPSSPPSTLPHPPSRKLKHGVTELGVHIADVSYFVTPGSLTDREAQSRSTTIYLADRRYDMLPAILSADLCSLLSNVDRCVCVCVCVVCVFFSQAFWTTNFDCLQYAGAIINKKLEALKAQEWAYHCRIPDTRSSFDII